MTEREKCPQCGQSMPLTKAQKKARLRIDASTIVPSSYVDGALVWIVDGDEGGEIGQDGRLTIQSLRAMLAAEKIAESREAIAVEIAAKLLAHIDGAEFRENGSAWVWRKPIKKRLIELAEKILNSEDES